MAKFALIGNPIMHSMSPALFRAAYGDASDTYDLVEAPDAKQALGILREKGYSGCNVTTPFKEDVMESVTSRDRSVEILGAANLLIIKGDEIIAHNTDYIGVRDIAERESLELGRGAKAIVIGMGGAGKAAALAAKDSGYNTLIANRSVQKAEDFAERIGIRAISIEDLGREIQPGCLIIYALPLGIEQIDRCTLEGATVLEANYRHPYLSGRKDIRKYIGGIEWLVAQAVPGFTILTGKNPDTRSMMKIAELAK